MRYDIPSELSLLHDFYAHAIDREFSKWIKACDPNLLAQQVNFDAIRLLNEIQCILDNETLEDPDCFYRIDAIVAAFRQTGLSTTRHWELE